MSERDQSNPILYNLYLLPPEFTVDIEGEEEGKVGGTFLCCCRCNERTRLTHVPVPVGICALIRGRHRLKFHFALWVWETSLETNSLGLAPIGRH